VSIHLYGSLFCLSLCLSFAFFLFCEGLRNETLLQFFFCHGDYCRKKEKRKKLMVWECCVSREK
jgi:hypothetical protein